MILFQKLSLGGSHPEAAQYISCSYATDYFGPKCSLGTAVKLLKLEARE